MKITKNISILSAVFGLALASTSCTTTERNTMTGAGIGAVAGALIADDSTKGAAIGGLAGAGGGYIYGKNKEKNRGY